VEKYFFVRGINLTYISSYQKLVISYLPVLEIWMLILIPVSGFGILIRIWKGQNSPRKEKMEKYHFTEEQDYCPRGLEASTGARKCPCRSKNRSVKAGSHHMVFARPIQLLRKVELTNAVWRFTGSTWKEMGREGVL
jgi:hypothetical protein